MTKTFILKIYRGEVGHQYWEEFELELKPYINVISSLMEIQKNPVNRQGKKVAPVTWEQGCLEEVCGSCSMLINGRPRQACTAIIEPILRKTGGNSITLAPFTKFPLVRDLVVNRSSMFNNLKRVQGWVSADGSFIKGFGPKISQDRQEAMYTLSTCMTCGCCSEGCPQVNNHSHFIGPAPVSQVRPITTIDIGANNGYFSIRAAQEYGSTAVMVDMQDRLEKICEYNTDLNTLICLNKQLTTQDLKELNRREHFDVLILFHVLHHIAAPDSWEEFLSEAFKLADNVIIQTPPTNDGFIADKPNIPVIERHLLSLPTGKVIGSFTRQSEEIRDHMIWFCLKPKDLHPSLYSKPRKQGISLATFKKLHGRHPSKERIKAMREKIPFYKRYFKGAITVQGNELN